MKTSNHCLLIAAALVLGVAPPGRSQATTNTGSSIPLIEMQAVPLDAAIANLATQTELNYILDPKLTPPALGADGATTPTVTLRYESLTAEQALRRLLAEHGLGLIENPETSVSRIGFTNQIAKPADNRWISEGTNAVIPLITMMSVPLPEAITQLARQARLNLVLDSSVSQASPPAGGRFRPPEFVNVRWRNLTARQAIAALAENYNLVVTRDPATDIIRVSRQP